MCVVVQRDNVCEIVVKRNNGGWWSFDSVVLWPRRRQDRDAVKCWGEWLRLRWSFYSSGGCESGRSRRVACAVVRIQCFSFSLIGKATGWRVAGRWSGGSELSLAQWKGSVIQRGNVTTSAGGEVAPGRGKRGNDASWADSNLISWKINKIYMVDSAGTNR
jgi:hypothetical protein